jgi:hypothetical protein
MSEPSLSAVKTLFALSRNVCFYQGCEEKLTDPHRPRVNARVAHIKGEHPGSARYDPAQLDPDRQGYPNLMLLCPHHHTLIDEFEPGDHPVGKLQDMKELHVNHTAGAPWYTDADLDRFAVGALVNSGYSAGVVGFRRCRQGGVRIGADDTEAK